MGLALVVGDATEQSGDVSGKTLRFLDHARSIACPIDAVASGVGSSSFGAVISHDPRILPPDLPVPEDDGGARHLVGARMPATALLTTDGRVIDLAALQAEHTVLYCYPRTGRPGEEPLTPDWDLIPGARGCTPESCSFRDHYRELRELKAEVFGLSTQESKDQQEAVARLELPFALLSDASLELTEALHLPTFTAANAVLLKRLTLVIRNAHVEHLWYPVFPPDRHGEQVLAWLEAHIG